MRLIEASASITAPNHRQEHAKVKDGGGGQFKLLERRAV